MDRDQLQPFLQIAEGEIAAMRSSLLIVAQSGDARDLGPVGQRLVHLQAAADKTGLGKTSDLIAVTIAHIGRLASLSHCPPDAAFLALDNLSKIEASIWEAPFHSDSFLGDVGSFVDASFDELVPPPAARVEEFEIDEETLDIFRSEADELLANINKSLAILMATPNDQTALWDIRRSAHTLKGAAGIVGLTEVSEIAHRMEDVLDKVVELRRDAVPGVIAFVTATAGRLDEIINSKPPKTDTPDLDALYRRSVDELTSEMISAAGPDAETILDRPATVAAAPRPIVRVSLDRLDDLIGLSRRLLAARSAFATEFAAFTTAVEPAETVDRLRSLLENGEALADEMQEKLLRVRMVRFGMLETRLRRAVHMTCVDESKQAMLEIENGETEIDTQIVDALVEPLLHLLKNAVVHGIELPEVRRLIGKDEAGTITIRIEADLEGLILSVIDDGAGISLPRLKDKALRSGIITVEAAEAMTDPDAMKLIFDRGLTTANKVDLNAGRGVGMGIVKESIEALGGSITVNSERQTGSTFSIVIPLRAKTEVDEAAPELPEAEPVTGSHRRSPDLVLVVDDSASIRRHTTKIVEEAGLRTIAAQDGAEALELLLSGQWQPDLILSDVEMPQIDGWEFLEYVKTDDNLGHIPVVLVTSLDSDEHRERARTLGASDYIVKPFSRTGLERVLGELGSNV